MTIIVRSEAGMEREHHVPQDKQLQVHAGDFVEAGDPLIHGPAIPHDILRIKGEESLYQYLLTEVQNVYRSQGVKINDKHIEIILNQMLRKVKVEDPGDSKFLPGEVVDKFRFRAGNELATSGMKIVEPGGTTYKEGDVVTKAELKEANEAAEAAGKDTAKGKKPKPARQDSAPGHHQGVPPERVIHLGGQLPGNDQGADRGCPGRRRGHAGRPQGERHPRPSDSGRNGIQSAPEPENAAPGRAARRRGTRAPASASSRGPRAGSPGRYLRTGPPPFAYVYKPRLLA